MVRRVPVSSLTIDPSNARKHDQRNLDAIAGSLGKFGQVEPLVVQKGTGKVIGGNGRLEVMRARGETEVDINEVECTDEEATALGIALNRTAELATWNDETLSRLLAGLPADLKSVAGFEASDIKDLLDRLAPTTVEEDDVPEPPKVAATMPGDLWILGGSRLLCGDSTKAADVLRVMNGEKAALCATDPPYLVDYTGERPNNTGKDWSGSYNEVDIKDAAGFFSALFANVLKVLAPNAAIYCWHAHKRHPEIRKAWDDLGIVDHQQIVWVKPTAVFGRVFWHFKHEPCMMGWAQGSMPPHDSNHEFNSVWEIDWNGKSRVVGNEHPTQKPVEIFARPMRKHTKRNDICFEPFSGSGSQLVAAAQLDRRCYAIELEPVFVDVAGRRWQDQTAQQATLESDGRTYAEVAAERLAAPEGEPEPAAQPGPTSPARRKRKDPAGSGAGKEAAASTPG